MKTEKRLKTFVSSPWLLAIIPSILIILLLPVQGTKYKIEVEDWTKGSANYVFCDLNSDSITELMNSGKGLPHSFVSVMDNDRRIYDQWNIQEDFHPDISELFFGNYDHDKYSEIYVFSVSNDSLFLNINEFFETNGKKTNRMFITHLRMVNGTITSNVQAAGFFDQNSDGFKDLYFTIQTGFGLEPRYLYCFDFVNQKLSQSQFTGTIFQYPSFFDSDGDNKPEIFGTSHAAGNYNFPSPYSDWSSWIMVYNEMLEFEFTPVGFYGITNTTELFPYSDKETRGYIASHNTSSADSTVIEPRILKYSLQGEKLNEVKYSEIGINFFAKCFVMEAGPTSRIFIFENDLLELDNNLEVINRTDAPFELYYNSFAEDVDNDGKKEFLYYSDKQKRLAVYNQNLKKLSETELYSSILRTRISHSYAPGKPHKMLFTNTESANILTMSSNKFYYLNYFAHVGIFLLIVLFIHIIKRMTISQFEQRENLKQRLLTLQLQGIKSQLDPHFTFNSLNSIASLIYLEERQTAYDYLNKFTSLLRGMLNDAERVYRTLREEIEFVTTYLEL
ncbi:MAG: histidine kinase, partial [Bacteroidia bacterium]|nr:histidine kinase [Bacteroidia bacterium]